MNSKKVQVAKLFRSKGVDASHIWLEGDRLVEAGFTAGVEYLQTWYKDKLVLTKANASGQFVHEHEPVKTIMRKVVKSGNNPAIRIEGMQVLRTFGKEFGFVQCTFSPGVIEIVGYVAPSDKTAMADENITRMSYGEVPPNTVVEAA
jgi:hypothetical protein